MKSRFFARRGRISDEEGGCRIRNPTQRTKTHGGHGEATHFRGEPPGDHGEATNFRGEPPGDRGEATNFRGEPPGDRVEATNFHRKATDGNEYLQRTNHLNCQACCCGYLFGSHDVHCL